MLQMCQNNSTGYCFCKQSIQFFIWVLSIHFCEIYDIKSSVKWNNKKTMKSFKGDKKKKKCKMFKPLFKHLAL